MLETQGNNKMSYNADCRLVFGSDASEMESDGFGEHYYEVKFAFDINV